MATSVVSPLITGGSTVTDNVGSNKRILVLTINHKEKHINPYSQCIYLPLTIIVTLSELSASLKPFTDTEHVYSPLSLLSSGENVVILVCCNPSSLDTIAVVSSLSQLTITRDGDTPLTTVAIQVRV